MVKLELLNCFTRTNGMGGSGWMLTIKDRIVVSCIQCIQGSSIYKIKQLSFSSERTILFYIMHIMPWGCKGTHLTLKWKFSIYFYEYRKALQKEIL